MHLNHFVQGDWHGGSTAMGLPSAVTGDVVATMPTPLTDFGALRNYAVQVGGPALRAMGFHDRARMLKALALYLNERREGLYQLSHQTGATMADNKIDIDGGIGTMLVIASKGRREMPDGDVYLDGGLEMLSRGGSFVGQHICTPLQGVAVHINAFNFPVWGMLEKLAPSVLAGVPSIVKPATATCYLTEACVRLIIDSGILPEGALQLVLGPTGDLLDQLGPQDVVSFTGSADTAFKLRSNPNLLRNGVRFVAEQDSLNGCVLGPDVTTGSPEMEIFVREVTRELTAKAGQKCTAIRRIMVPAGMDRDVIDALRSKLGKTVVGNPVLQEVTMGALASQGQRNDVCQKLAVLETEAERVIGDPAKMDLMDASADTGAFLPPMVLHCKDPDAATAVHEAEAFGPVTTIMPYRDAAHAADLLNRGGGSLVASVITHDPGVARAMTLGSGAFHGRLYFDNRISADEATGHGSPLPHMVHGGPGRAGGGEELGGIRGVLHYMQRTAIQGSPDIIRGVTGQYVKGAQQNTEKAHPFTRTFDDVEIGDTLKTPARKVTMEDIETFAHFTGDTFYAHMDEDAAKANPFFPGRVAHGYLLLSFAAGLFVQPDPGPVLANTGLKDLSFQKPVSPGDTIGVSITVARKTRRTEDYGEVQWLVILTNQDGDQVAEYTLLTMNAYA